MESLNWELIRWMLTISAITVGFLIDRRQRRSIYMATIMGLAIEAEYLGYVLGGSNEYTLSLITFPFIMAFMFYITIPMRRKREAELRKQSS